ncbi:type II toxin-antitoxin system RelE/ParE family toxin [Pseudoxanthomonas wuyuanensis]
MLSPQAWRDIEKLAEFLFDSDPINAAQTGELLISGLNVLESHPLIGREVEHGLRELLISRGRSGYAALYRYYETEDTALVLTLRHQRESGFPSLG